MQVAVDIQGQGGAVFFHQSIEPFVITAQILAVQNLVAGHSVHFLFADASNVAGCLSGACPAGIAWIILNTIHYIRISEGIGEVFRKKLPMHYCSQITPVIWQSFEVVDYTGGSKYNVP